MQRFTCYPQFAIFFVFKGRYGVRRLWNSWLGAVVLVMGFGMAGCGAEPQPLVFGAPVWRNGENSSYQVTDRTGKLAGTAIVSVIVGNEENPGGWTLRREINAGGGFEVATVLMSGKGYIPVKSSLIRTDTTGSQMVEATIARGQVDITLTSYQGATTYQRVSVPSDIRDERTLLTIARSLPLAEKYITSLNSFLPVVGIMERVTVEVRKRERVTVPAGEYDTWLVEFRTTDRTTQAWIAVDAPYPVVKLIDARSKGLFELTKFVAGE